MRSALSSARMVRVLALALPCLSPLMFGCNEEAYPTDLRYPLRSDPIVDKQPTTEVWETTRPGQLDLHIASFKEGTLNPGKLSAKDRDALEKTLEAVFGTPANPTVKIEDSTAVEQLKELKLDGKTADGKETILQAGSKAYRRHCMHCHGVTGDGRGPTGPWVNPHPRDYRAGKFKFVSADADGRKPRREDIRRTLERGIEGTSMPSFSLLTEDEKEHLISYVTHLSLRGEAELDTMRAILKEQGLEGDGSVRGHIENQLPIFVKQWADANTRVLQPAAYPLAEGDKEQLTESIRRGFKLFNDTSGAASCIKCHVDYGRQVQFRYDDWGSLIRPANLTSGVYRGGRRPIDLYWRIKGGIPPSGMPGANLNVDKEKKIDEYWDLVNFVQALPYPMMLPPDIRGQVYTHLKDSAERAER